MPALQVRDFPDDLYEQLKLCAKKEHRSVAQQTIACVEGYIRAKQEEEDRRIAERALRYERDPIWLRHEMPPEQVEERRELFARIDALPEFEVPDDFPSAVELIREDRETR